jgi:hypothetical protein
VVSVHGLHSNELHNVGDRKKNDAISSLCRKKPALVCQLRITYIALPSSCEKKKEEEKRFH